MAAHFQGRLDLDKFRRFRDKSRKSLGLPIQDDESPVNSSGQFRQFRRSTGSMVNAPPVAGEEDLSKTEINPFPEKRKQRFNKFRERMRESHSPSVKESSLQRMNGSHLNNAVEGSPHRPIVLADNGKKQLGKSIVSSPHRDDSTFLSNRSHGTSSTVPLSQVSSFASSRSPPGGRDRIEESRSKNYKPVHKFRASRNRDRSRSVDNKSGQKIIDQSKSMGTQSSRMSREEDSQQKSFGRHS